MVTKHELLTQFRALGIPDGAILLVHTAFSRVQPIEGGPEGLIEVLQAAIGPTGTLVMPSMTDDDDHAFDPLQTPCAGMGIVADTFWRLPGVLRSDSPHAFAARGPAAEDITAPHPVDFPHGPDSPVGRVSELGGFVLLLGIGHDADTTIHLAEATAGVRYRRPKHATIRGPQGPMRVEYQELDHCCENFSLADEWLDATGLQRRGPAGHGTARLARATDIVTTVAARLRRDETAFLHPYGVDVQCDEARASMPTRSSSS